MGHAPEDAEAWPARLRASDALEVVRVFHLDGAGAARAHDGRQQRDERVRARRQQQQTSDEARHRDRTGVETVQEGGARHSTGSKREIHLNAPRVFPTAREAQVLPQPLRRLCGLAQIAEESISIYTASALAQCESFPSPPRPQLQRLDLLPRHCAARCHPPSSPRHARGCHRA